MNSPFIYLTAHRVDPTRRDELDALLAKYTETISANEGLLAHYAYYDEEGTELTLVQVHRDAASGEQHMQVAGPLIAQGVALAETLRVEVYGEPGPAMSKALEANAERGARAVRATVPAVAFVR
ncbi:antibiotic biosynthesis monooxygenase [Actinacidiphila epipremni]|jgi:quinol monooxygenase YgiN|uniref:ABM domain-containing protein n=1 Tax=Actinacidiphila epipremni TaxID=2053013 RepID=A0ABX0ZUC8_9ACTN|nr:antibiotic biosynthesis monooxygenase [Actinacidiphila epipremni]NJP46181.1 hypothetical protein [Actinacidiphila epipremni]